MRRFVYLMTLTHKLNRSGSVKVYEDKETGTYAAVSGSWDDVVMAYSLIDIVDKFRETFGQPVYGDTDSPEEP